MFSIPSILIQLEILILNIILIWSASFPFYVSARDVYPNRLFSNSFHYCFDLCSSSTSAAAASVI
jgi:hypothetical protein